VAKNMVRRPTRASVTQNTASKVAIHLAAIPIRERLAVLPDPEHRLHCGLILGEESAFNALWIEALRDPTLTCSACGTMSRARTGAEGAKCGKCHAALSPEAA
jgi:hypothetical protein